MSRDREVALFDGVRSFDQRHPILSFAAAWLILVAAFTLTMVGPLVGTFAYDWLFGFDPNDHGQIAAAWFGGSAVLATAIYAVTLVRDVVEKR